MLADPMPVLVNASSSMSTANLRYSRRSACDRCRAYKLRCQRDERLGKPCERCAKSRLACTTTFDPASTSTSSSAGLSAASHAPRPNTAQAQQPRQQQQQQPQQKQQQQHMGNAQGRSRPPREHHTIQPPLEPLHLPLDQGDRRHGTFAQLTAQAHMSHSPPSQREPADDGHFQQHREALLSLSLSDNQPQHSSLPRSASDPTSIEGTDNAGGDNLLLDQHALGIEPMDFSLPDMGFDANELSMLMADHSPTRAPPGSRGSGGDVGSRMFSHEDEITVCGLGPSTNMGWQSQAGQVEPCLDAGRDGRGFDSEMMAGPANTQRLTSSYKDLLKLSLELVEDREILDTQAPLTSAPSIIPLTCSSTQQQQPVNRVLNQTARFWEIVKALSSASPDIGAKYTNGGVGASSSGDHGSDSQTRSNSTSSSASLINLNGLRHGWANASLNGNGDPESGSSTSSSSSQPATTPSRQDHLLMVNLVMTYVNLLRNCRAVFTRLYHALQVTPSPSSNAILSLPSLQFGEFQLENNVTIQVKVLIELTSGMLQRIGNALGINAGSGPSASAPDDRKYRLPFLNDPVAVSTREIILSQESVHGGVHGGEPPLMDIMTNLKRVLERR